MNLKKRYILLFTFLTQLVFAQVKVGQWVDHLSYDYANSVAKVDRTVYVSNGSGLAKYNIDDNSVDKLTKVEGLSDVGVQFVRRNPHNNALMVIYKNTNIDVIRPDGTITNFSDIKRKSIQGKKYINEVTFKGNFAYLACGFGIVVFDTDRLEVKETYYIGNGIINTEIYQVAKNDTAIFAATPNGIYYGSLSSNLNNYQNWKTLNTGLPSGPYNGIVNFNGKIIANYSEKIKTNQSFKDTLFQYDGFAWGKFPYSSGSENRKLLDFSDIGRFLIIDQWGLQIFTTSWAGSYISQYGFDNATINDVFCAGGNQFYIADGKYGLVDSKGPSGNNYVIKVNGPLNNFINDIEVKDGIVVVAPVNLGETYTNQYLGYKPNMYQNKEWVSLKSVINDSIRDINAVCIDPNDKTHIAFGCMDRGVVTMRNGQFDKIYHTGNTPMIGYQGTNDLRVSGVSFDKNSNLWVSITIGKKCVSVLKNNGSWVLLDFEQFVVDPTVTKIIFDKYDQAWIMMPRNIGLMVYKDVNGLSQPNNSNTKKVSVAKGSGGLPSNDIYSICEDKDGHIWVGTATGVAVFYNPENVFSGGSWDSQQILIEQDGKVQILLENDIITAIAVDGANRKWIGTQASGVYCLSSDGQKQIYHFTTDNSPLYSNLVRDIAVDETTGDVFIGTVEGVQSYRTEIIKGFEDFTNVHAYPNPVRPGFAGPVYITGLIDEANVKITDVAGNLVWETTSEGGQIAWDLKNFSGTKVASGVYMIYCASANGDKSATSKLLIIN